MTREFISDQPIQSDDHERCSSGQIVGLGIAAVGAGVMLFESVQTPGAALTVLGLGVAAVASFVKKN